MEEDDEDFDAPATATVTIKSSPDPASFQFQILCTNCDAILSFQLAAVYRQEPTVTVLKWVLGTAYYVDCPRCSAAVDVGGLFKNWMKVKIQRVRPYNYGLL